MSNLVQYSIPRAVGKVCDQEIRSSVLHCLDKSMKRASLLDKKQNKQKKGLINVFQSGIPRKRLKCQEHLTCIPLGLLVYVFVKENK